jgi:hypothetical protein
MFNGIELVSFYDERVSDGPRRVLDDIIHMSKFIPRFDVSECEGVSIIIAERASALKGVRLIGPTVSDPQACVTFHFQLICGESEGLAAWLG